MNNDLLARLRAVGGLRHDGATRWYVNPDGQEAANEIEYLKRIIANLLDDGDEIDRAAARLAIEEGMTDSPGQEAALDADAKAYRADNLVTRLRDLNDKHGIMFDDTTTEAADRIEQLEALVSYLAGTNKDHVRVMLAGNPIVCDEIISKARDALKEGKDEQ